MTRKEHFERAAQTPGDKKAPGIGMQYWPKPRPHKSQRSRAAAFRRWLKKRETA